jgi:hypothetical protein
MWGKFHRNTLLNVDNSREDLNTGILALQAFAKGKSLHGP